MLNCPIERTVVISDIIQEVNNFVLYTNTELEIGGSGDNRPEYIKLAYIQRIS